MSSAREVRWQALMGQGVEARPMESTGRNSRIYRLELADGRVLAGKTYFQSEQDTRDRLAAEWTGLSLSGEAGLDVPRIVTGSREHAALVLEYVDGGPVTGLSVMDIDTAVYFLRVLGDVARSLDDPASVGPASEACFSGQDLARNLESRFERLADARGDEPEYADMARLLDDLRQDAARRAAKAEKIVGRTWGEPVSQFERTLSPSDFGFHNAVRRADGTICFLDFEYFGWDDPAKTICDFVLHPAMDLDEDLAARFTARSVRALDRGGLVPRLLAYYPLFALKWCCIFLNEFVADDRARRRFAGLDARREVLRVQLGKARTYLENIDEGYERFRSSVA